MRLRIDLAYDGAGFHGWARQDGLRTVQGEVEAALATVLRIEPVALTCAGRTDAGVHARGQVAHVDLDEPSYDGEELRRRVDAVLPDDVCVRRVVAAPEGFDARFSAVWRRYAYRIADRPGSVDPLTRGHVLAWRRALDVDAMSAASRQLLGHHDFASFCRRREGATTIRRLLELSWARNDCGVLVGTVRADAFCHHMVRSVVGCLVAVGEGRRTPGWAGQVLAAASRDSSITVVPAHGLTLEEVGYPPDGDLAGQAEATRRVRTLDGEDGADGARGPDGA
jgi:tRNA pseudouridine38-40 synthase